MTQMQARIALTRMGIGARPGEIKNVAGGPKDWLLAQIKNPPQPYTAKQLQPSSAISKRMLELRNEKKRTKTALKLLPVFREVYKKEVKQRFYHGLVTPHGFHERLVRFWSNHFAVSVGKFQTFGLVGAYEREAIRPHITGKFEDMLLAVMRHPAMLFYLDNVTSIGPNSKVGARRKKGLNENLAREALELHTLGVGGGYSQTDVEELAKALTGWTINSYKITPGKEGEFHFYARIHEPGRRVFMGKTYGESGEAQAQAILRDAASHPSTAKHIGFKLARHFIADEPLQKDVDILAKAFTDSGGDLRHVYKALLGLDSIWHAEQHKFKQPEEFILSAYRGFPPESWGSGAKAARGLTKTYNAFGQVPFRVPSPKGWPDTAADWAGPDAIKKRIEWAQALASKTAGVDPSVFFDAALGDMAAPATRRAIARAESREQGLVLALMSPEFQRR